MSRLSHEEQAQVDICRSWCNDGKTTMFSSAAVSDLLSIIDRLVAELGEADARIERIKAAPYHFRQDYTC